MNTPIEIFKFFNLLPQCGFPTKLPAFLGRLVANFSEFSYLLHRFIDDPLPPSFIREQDRIIQYNSSRVTSSEFGRSESFFDVINYPATELRANVLMIAVLMRGIDAGLIQFIKSIKFDKYSDRCIIEFNSFGTFQMPYYCHESNTLQYRETILDKIVVMFCSVGIFKCIYLYYPLDFILEINAETLNPDHSVLIFNDYKSVIMTLNKIIREKILQPIIDKRMPLLLYSQAIKNKTQNVIKFTLCTFRIAHIESFL